MLMLVALQWHYACFLHLCIGFSHDGYTRVGVGPYWLCARIFIRVCIMYILSIEQSESGMAFCSQIHNMGRVCS